MSKIILFFIFSLFICLAACTNEQAEKDSTQTAADTTASAPVVGGDADEHGCKPSAGYQWSVVRNECIRIFESGIRLDVMAQDLDKSLSAFVVFQSDTLDAQAELYIPTEKTSILLNKDNSNEAGLWKNENYVLSQWRGMYSLEDNNKKLLYQGPAVR